MKQLIILLIAGFPVLSASAQTKVKNYTQDKDLSRWVLDLNGMGGIYSQQLDIANSASNYLNGVNINTGKAEFKNGSAFGGNLQLGVFFGKNKHWGLGTGILYLRESGSMTLRDFHAEYQSVDNNGDIFRQVVSGNDITEKIKSDNFNIPLVLKYKNRFSKRWGFTADLGAFYNISMKNAYTTNASFDYEAIYKFISTGDGGYTSVYDPSPTPGSTDFLITRDHFNKNNPNGNVDDYFNQKKGQGYLVGLGVSPGEKSGKTSYDKGSIGFLFQPSVNYFFSDRVALNVGAYVLYQPFKNEAANTYALTNKPGEYNPVINSVSKAQTQSYGGNIGLRIFLGKKTAPMLISGVDLRDPSYCGDCDGSIAIHGLPAGKQVNVEYKVNGATKTDLYSGVVNPSGTIIVPSLCAGTYTDIRAIEGRRSVNTASVTLINPELQIRAVSSDPTAYGACDATITFRGLRAGQTATVAYSFNGRKQEAYVTTVSSDNTVQLSGLCEGTYSDMTVMSNNCVGQVSPVTFALKAPKPVVIEEPEAIEDLKSILFEFNSSNIKPVSYGLIDDAYLALMDDKNLYLVIEGNTDAVGSVDYNLALSERRALAVQDYLVNKGINRNRITIYAKGKSEPIATNNNAEGRRQNRRAEMHLKIKD